MNFLFNEDENTAVITCCHILEKGSDILYVSRDDDGMWQFLCGETHKTEDARVVSLNEIFEFDNTISELSNMSCGYIAERINKESEWIIKRR